MLCVFSIISSPGMMDLQNEVLVAFRQNQIIVLLPRPAGSIYVSNFNHSGGNISVEESSSAENGGAVLWRAPVAVLGTAPDVCGDCSLLDTLLGSGKTLAIRDSEICVFEMFGVFAIQSRWSRHS